MSIKNINAEELRKMKETAEKKKPDCKLIGEDGNIFNLMGIASRTLVKTVWLTRLWKCVTVSVPRTAMIKHFASSENMSILQAPMIQMKLWMKEWIFSYKGVRNLI